MHTQIYRSIVEAIGHTPMVELQRIGRDMPHTFYVKVESMNPGGSIKDRLAYGMIDQAVREGKLGDGGTIIETTSGNTGMGLAMIAAAKGFKALFTVPDKVSKEKIAMLEAMGAKVVVCPSVKHDHPDSYYNVAKRLAQTTPNSFYCNQYENMANPDAHFRYTGPELYEQLDGQLDYFVCCVGTGGTISGVSRYMKSQNAGIQTVGVDPVGSVYYDYFRSGELKPQTKKYKIEGMGKDFIPGALDTNLLDDMVQVSDAQAFDMTRRLAQEEGIFVGGSSGAAVAGMLAYAQNIQEPKRMMTILPDSGTKYLSKIFDDSWMQAQGFVESV
jgi:cystathionine beta-synthase